MKINDSGVANFIDIDPSVKGNFTVNIVGNNHSIRIEQGANLNQSTVSLRGHNSRIHIGALCNLRGEFQCIANNTILRIGPRTTSMRAFIVLHEAGNIEIGEDCMFSGDVRMNVSDVHSILDRSTGKRINPPRDIRIGDHVWLAFGVTVLKGAVIGSGSVIGAKSLVLGNIPENVVAVGTPARVVRENIEWRRERL